MEPQKVTFYNEISLMMFGFGDSHKPNPDTVRLIESIVLKQLRIIVQEALKYSDGKNLKGKELVFLMRRDKKKMRRFVQYLKNKQLKSMFSSMHSNVIDIDKEPKPKGELMKFIEYIDETGEFTEGGEEDEVREARRLRADRISQALDEKQYLEFCKARSASFCSRDITTRNTDKLRLWVDPKKEINFQPNALTVLAYMAYQTVAEITDYALLVRMDGKTGTDPLHHLYGSYYNASMFNGEYRIGASGTTNLDYSRIYSGQPPISVNEIKEVMRRVHCPQAGKLTFGGKLPETAYTFAL